MKLIKDENYQRKERKFFKKHTDLLSKYGEVLNKLKGEFSEFYSCSLTYEYRIICIFLIQDETIVLVDIGCHDEVY